MTPEDAVRRLSAAGLRARVMPENSFCDIHVAGDARDADAGVSSSTWACWIDHRADGWFVYPPPHAADGHGPELIVPELDDAVSLTLFLFAHRPASDRLTTGGELEEVERAFRAWKRDR